MKSLATLDPAAATSLGEQLRSAGIAFEIRAVTEESGVTASELFVHEQHYEAACNLVDAWLEVEAGKSRLICPKCRSAQLERVPHDSVEVLLRCMDCGSEILAQT
jgi:Zn finger protein HypA/HybF involved in hydrogenase expression